MARLRIIIAFLVALGATVAAWPLGQTPAQKPDPQQPTFQSQANLVHVDVYPRRNGHVIEDLAAKDFRVLEDGKPQAIEMFQFVKVQPRANDAERRDPNTAEEGKELAADPLNRVFVIFLDTYHLTRTTGAYAKKPLLDMLDRMLAPNDLFGVSTPRMSWRALTFGRELITLDHDLSEYWDWIGRQDSRDLDPEDFDLGLCGASADVIERRHEEIVLNKLSELITYLGNVREERKALVVFTEGWQLFKPDVTIAAAGPKDPPPMAPGVYIGPGGKITIDNQARNSSDTSCRVLLDHLAALDDDQVFKNLLEQARKANVVIYPVDPGGLRAPVGVAALNQVEHKEDVLHTLASQTDGVAVVATNDLETGIRRIIDEQAAFYVLGYYSTNRSHDGGYRRIQVQVAQAGVDVVARHGYTAPTAADVAVLRTPVVSKPVDAATAAVTTAVSALARLHPGADVFSYAGVPSRNTCVVEVELPNRLVRSSAWAQGGDVQVVIAGASGDVAGQARARMTAGTRGAIVRVPMAASVAGPWSVRVRVRGDAVGDTISDVLEVPVPENDEAIVVGAPVMFRATSGPQGVLQPSADFQFERTEHVHVEWPVLAPLDQRLARVLDRTGQPVPVDVILSERVADGGPIVAGEIALTPLAPGDYVIELTASAGGQSVRRLVAIRVGS